MPQVKITIGGKPFSVPELTIYQLRRTAKLGTKVLAMQTAAFTDENIDETFDAVVALVELWLGDGAGLTRDDIERKMTQSEMMALVDAIGPAMTASGVKPGEGQGAAGAGADPSEAKV